MFIYLLAVEIETAIIISMITFYKYKYSICFTNNKSLRLTGFIILFLSVSHSLYLYLNHAIPLMMTGVWFYSIFPSQPKGEILEWLTRILFLDAPVCWWRHWDFVMTSSRLLVFFICSGPLKVSEVRLMLWCLGWKSQTKSIHLNHRVMTVHDNYMIVKNHKDTTADRDDL